MKKPSEKGGDFERWFCHRLSEWWSYDKRNDLFWRTAGSGARATNRSKKNLTTVGSYGDIHNTDPSAAPLMKFTTIELKRGYKDFHPGMYFDSKKAWVETEFWKFISQAVRSSVEAVTPFWWLVGQRDFKRAVIYFPAGMEHCMPNLTPEALKYPCIKINPPHCEEIMGMDLEEFFDSLSPEDVLTPRDPE